jgi:hypothetical protein
MPRSKRPSFLTKQKEQQRRAKANEKRDQRRARKQAKGIRDNSDIEQPTEPQVEESIE